MAWQRMKIIMGKKHSEKAAAAKIIINMKSVIISCSISISISMKRIMAIS